MLFKAVCNLDCDLSVAKRFYWKGHLFWIWTGEWLPLFIMELAWVWLNWEEIFLSTLFWQPLVKSLDIFLICFSLIIGDENQRWYLGKETIFRTLPSPNLNLNMFEFDQELPFIHCRQKRFKMWKNQNI